jgi:hypothetical protein
LDKRKDVDVSSGRPSYFKRGKPQFSQFRRKEGIAVETVQSSSIGPTGGQQGSRSGSRSVRGMSEQRSIVYPLCIQCGQKHHQGGVMYVEENIDGGIAHIWARDVITAMGMAMLERIALGS